MSVAMAESNTSQIDKMLKSSIENLNTSNFNEAEKLIGSTLMQDPENATANFGMGKIATLLGKHNIATGFYLKATEANKRNGDFWECYISSLIAENRQSEAKKAVKKAKKAGVDAKRVDPLLKMAKKTQASESKNTEIPTSELEELKRLLSQNQYQNAINKAKQLESNYPSSGNLQKIQGYLHLQVLDFNKALHYNKKANTFIPNDCEILNNIAISLQHDEKLDEALKFCRQSLSINPDYEAAAATFLSILNKQDNHDFASSEVIRIAKKFDRSAFIQFCYANLLGLNGDYKDAADTHEYILNELIDLNPTEENLSLSNKIRPPVLFTALLFSTSCAALKDRSIYINRAKKFDSMIQKYFPVIFEPNKEAYSPQENGKIRIGFISGDFKSHPVAFFIKPVLDNLDRNNFEIFLYSSTVSEDHTTEVFKAMDVKWKNIAGETISKTSETVLRDNINIMIDLSGHTASNKLDLFSKRIAPIQISWLGYGDSTGVENMDYILCNDHLIHDNEKPYYTEELLKLPQNYLCYDPPHEAVEIKPTPAEKNGYITFGCFNHYRKINDAVIKSWAKILDGTPDSKILIKHKQLEIESEREFLISRFKELGIPKDRILFKGYAPSIKDHLLCFNDIDISLDPYPYTGATTTCESLWMGTPVVTFGGDRYIARMSKSILTYTGLTDWIANNEQEYADLAIQKASNIEELVSLHKNLREKFEQSPLCNSKQFTADFEKTIKTAWDNRKQ